MGLWLFANDYPQAKLFSKGDQMVRFVLSL